MAWMRWPEKQGGGWQLTGREFNDKGPHVARLRTEHVPGTYM